MKLAALLSRKTAHGRREEIADPTATRPDQGPAGTESAENPALDDLLTRVYALSTGGRYGEALRLATGALAQHPAERELLFARASILFDSGRMREAREGFLRAEASGLSRTALYLNLAWSCHLLYLSEEAERHARKAVELDPSAIAGHFGLGTILQRLKRYPAAMRSYERALELAPNYADAAVGVAHCKLEQHEYLAAESWMRRAIALSADRPQYWTNLGVALANQERYPEAFAALRRAGELESALGAPRESVVDLGFAMILTGEDEAAAALYRRYLPELPDPRAHGHFALALLALGQFREGWEQYEFRWLQEPHLSHRPDFVQPVWAGQDPAGKTILLRSEQGAGDIIQFARFAVSLKALGATVVLQVRPELIELARGFAGADHVFAPPTAPPPFDYYVHLMSLPHVLGTELATIPAAIPYLHVDPVRLQRWAPRFAGRGLKVGVAWAGNPAHLRDLQRSIPFKCLNDLWQMEGVRYFSLQKALRPGEVEQLPPATTLVNLGPELEDFADTAAVIAQLDVVICVDTAIAHLAGALGKPVWLLLPAIGDFRWLKDRDDTPWYPTMRVFRQRQMGQWDEVVGRVLIALQQAQRGDDPVDLPPPASHFPADSPMSSSLASAPATFEAPTTEPKLIARVCEARYGLMQYLPEPDPAARSIALYGEFLQPQLDLLVRLLPPGAHVVEAGSGIGVHALALARWVGAAGHLFLYETRPVLQRLLLRNLQVNGVAQGVTLMRRDLAGPHGSPPEIAHDAAMGSVRAASPDAESATETLDELLLERLDLLKIRSGDAAEVIEGASATLWRLRPTLFIAAENATAVTGLAAQMETFGYRCWKMETPLFSPSNFNRRDTDVFGGEVALAVLAIPEEAGVTVVLDGCDEVKQRYDRTTTTLPVESAPAALHDSTLAVASADADRLRWLRKLLP